MGQSHQPGPTTPSTTESMLAICEDVLSVLVSQETLSPLSGNTFRVSYHLCIHHTLGTVFELHQSSENMHRYFHIILDITVAHNCLRAT